MKERIKKDIFYFILLMIPLMTIPLNYAYEHNMQWWEILISLSLSFFTFYGIYIIFKKETKK